MPDSLAVSLATDLATRLVAERGSPEAARSYLLANVRPDHDRLQLGRLLTAVSKVRT
jgi:hypothetical protein